MSASTQEMRRILIIDNDRDSVTVLAALMSELGCQVSYTYDPRLALALAKHCKPDVALVDLRMPYVTGFDLAAAFKLERELRGCALVAVSGYGDDGYGLACAAAGFDAYLPKPATLEQMMAVLDDLVPRKRKVVAKAGIEPATHGFSVRCSTN